VRLIFQEPANGKLIDVNRNLTNDDSSFLKKFTIFAPEEPIPEGRLLFRLHNRKNDSMDLIRATGTWSSKRLDYNGTSVMLTILISAGLVPRRSAAQK
jgi:hypothetical protein